MYLIIYVIIRYGISIWCIPFIKEMQISNNLKKICLVEKFTDTGHKCHSVTVLHKYFNLTLICTKPIEIIIQIKFHLHLTLQTSFHYFLHHDLAHFQYVIQEAPLLITFIQIQLINITLVAF